MTIAMPVKDLVGLYETRARTSSLASSSSATSPREGRARAGTVSAIGARFNSASISLSPPPQPPTSPARFIRHPSPVEKKNHKSLDASKSPPPPQARGAVPLGPLPSFSPPPRSSRPLTTNTRTTTHDDTKDITEELTSAQPRHLNAPPRATGDLASRMEKWLDANVTSEPDSYDTAESAALLPNRTSIGDDSSVSSHSLNKDSKDSYPLSPLGPKYQNTLSAASSSTAVKHTTSSSTLVHGGKHLGPHKPVPASTVFARKAHPLYLPKLDEYLASLPKPSFSPSPNRGEEVKGKSKVAMFPPMDLLAASGKTIEDLEANSEVAPWWRNRTSIMGSIVGIVIGLGGSSALATFYSLQGLVNTVQMFALILSTIVPRKGVDVANDWRQLLLGTIPNILALNFASTLLESIICLLMFMAIAGVLLYFFRRFTQTADLHRTQEGLQRYKQPGSGWSIMVVSFLLTVIYLPLSTMAVHVLVWSDDLWVVPNPYTNATTSPPNVPSLGPSNVYRDPLDFCWTTTMQRNEINWAPAAVILAAIVVVFLTIWFPIRLHHVINQSVPIVDPYTELGKRRSQSDMDREYQRLLGRDRSPYSFLYGGFRRNWATFESLYLFAKLSTLIIVAVLDPNNCLFRSIPSHRVAVVRQFLLTTVAIAFFFLQCFWAPFLDPVGNANEWTSRMNFVLTAAVALVVEFDVPGTDILNGVVLYIIYGVTYGLTVYFAIIDTNLMRRVVKKLARRIDFSIDISSPRVDISSSSPHTKRRIWQEAITTLFLTSPECKMPENERMDFVQACDSEFPPYLLDFQGSPAERHVENLKILREVGYVAYNKGVHLVSGPDHEWFRYLSGEIQQHFVGPDCYWRNPTASSVPGCTKYFGNAWWIPFPPTLVLKYDDGPLAVLKTVSDLEMYVAQNTSAEIRRRREIRMALRALDGQRVIWPYEYTQPVGARDHLWCCKGRRYRARTARHFQTCILRVKHKGHFIWEGTQLGSGFDIELSYAKDVQVSGDIIGLNDDYDLTRPLAHFLTLNRQLIPGRLAELEGILSRYRAHYQRECVTKADVLTYRFLSFVYDRPRDPNGLAESSIQFERDLRVRQLMTGSEDVFQSSFERLAAVSGSEIATWWYIFWDDLWRRNYETISGLNVHASDFNPYYPTSIAYTPLPRPALEAFLSQRGLLHKSPKFGDFFHAGFLNKIYLRMNDIVFRGSSRVIWLHLGDDSSEELDMEEVDMQTMAGPSTLGTGAGTDHDDASIRPRPAYRWEGILSDPVRKGHVHRSWLAKMGAWLGVTPLWRIGLPSNGLSLDVRLDNGRYVLLDYENGATEKTSYLTYAV